MVSAALAASIARLRLQLEAAVLRRLNAGAGLGEIRPAGVYVRDAAALERLASGSLRPQGSHRKAAAAVASALHAARALESESSPGDASATRLSLLGVRFGLAPEALELVLLAAAFELDPDCRDLVHALAGRRRTELAAETCIDALAELPAIDLAAQLAPGSILRASRVLAIEGDGLSAQLAIRSHTLRWLSGDDGVPSALALLATIHRPDEDLGVALPETTTAALHTLTPLLATSAATPPLVTLRGPRGSGRRAAAHQLARARAQPLLAVAIAPLLAAERQRRSPLLADVLTVATMLDAAVYLADVDALWDESGNADLEHVAALRRHRGMIIVSSSGRGGHVDVQRANVVVPMTRAALDDRERAWRHALQRHGPEVSALAAELAGRYVIGPGAVAEVVAEADSHASATSTAMSRDSLESAVGRRLSLRLGTFGSVVARKSLFGELILPEEIVDTLRDLLAMVRERSLILEKWGFQRHLGISRGVAALFSGEPGTGKTMAASVIASELGLELVRIDLSAVVSKFVGETEKNLSKIFDEAQDAHAMLLFDEADSLFGKRTELKSAQDRFANLEVNYILQRMETFDGISVLTTNAENAIDPALQRRLNFRIRFPEPELEERALLWRQLLPPATGLGDGVDFHALAERFEMTGGYIKNAVVRAAVIAARAGRELTAEDLWAGAHHEYAEMGKVMPQLPMPGRRL